MLLGTSMTISDFKIFHGRVEGPLKVAPPSISPEVGHSLRYLSTGLFHLLPEWNTGPVWAVPRLGQTSFSGGKIPQVLIPP